MINYNDEYDNTDPISIERYAQALIGKTFQEIIEKDGINNAEKLHEPVKYAIQELNEDKKNKGNLGQIIEERFFHYRCNNDSRPDFPEAGVELKVSPYKIGTNGKKSAKERLILTMIDYCNVIKEEFETGHLWTKARLILLVYYLYTKDVKFNVDYPIHYVKLFTPPSQDIKIIKHDYDLIIGKIKAGKAHELSEGDTLYLGAATKSSSSADRRVQPYGNELAKPRAFSFKTSYMTYVLNNYIVPGKSTYEPIIKDFEVDSFEDYVADKINSFKGYTVEQLCTRFHVNYEKRPKNLEALLAYRILGISGNHAEEFEKANIVVKTIRIEKNNTIDQSMSFPNFKFKELVQEKWEDSTFGNYLEQTRFMFVVYKFNRQDVLELMGCQFWNIPYQDLQGEVRRVWEKTKQVLIEGLEVKVINGKNYNNFPGLADSRICHVRPHGKNAKDTYELPDGSQYTKQCFWLNKSYILSQLDEKFLKK